MTERAQRRLIAVASADMAGYSRLMGEDEAGTLSVLIRFRSQLLAPVVRDNGGTVAKSMTLSVSDGL